MSNTQAIITVLIILITLAPVVYFLKFRKAKFKVYSDKKQKTPKGVLVCSKSGVSTEILAAIDDEFVKLFWDVRLLGYQTGINFDYVVYILHDYIISQETGLRCFKIRADDIPLNYTKRQRFIARQAGIRFIRELKK